MENAWKPVRWDGILMLFSISLQPFLAELSLSLHDIYDNFRVNLALNFTSFPRK